MRQILTAVLLSIFAIAYAANPKPQLGETESWDGYYYTYISSELLHISPSLIKSERDLRGFPMEKLQMAEISRSQFNGANKKSKILIDNIIKNNDLALMATAQENDSEKISWYAKYKGSGEKAVVEKFFVVKYEVFGNSLTMIYLEGEFTFADLKNFIK